MSKIMAAYLCGHKSRYGMAHLEPIINNFDVSVVVIASDKRWSKFRNKLSGEQLFLHEKGGVCYLKRLINNIISLIRSRYDRVHHICRKYNIPLLVCEDINDKHFFDALKDNYKFSVLLSAAYPQILKEHILNDPRYIAINFHPSLLPKFRGAHPHYWVIRKGEEVTGVTAHVITSQIDEGGIVDQISFNIKNMYYSELYTKIVKESERLVIKVRERLERGAVNPVPQDNLGRYSYYRNDREIHNRIFWDVMEGEEIMNIIRTERGYFFLGQKKVNPKKASLDIKNKNMTNQLRVPAGIVVEIRKDAMVISTKCNRYVSISIVRCECINFTDLYKFSKVNGIYVGARCF